MAPGLAGLSAAEVAVGAEGDVSAESAGQRLGSVIQSVQ